MPAAAHDGLLRRQDVRMAAAVELREAPEKLVELRVGGWRGLLRVRVVAEVAVEVVDPGRGCVSRDHIADDACAGCFEGLEEGVGFGWDAGS